MASWGINETWTVFRIEAIDVLSVIVFCASPPLLADGETLSPSAMNYDAVHLQVGEHLGGPCQGTTWEITPWNNPGIWEVYLEGKEGEWGPGEEVEAGNQKYSHEEKMRKRGQPGIGGNKEKESKSVGAGGRGSKQSFLFTASPGPHLALTWLPPGSHLALTWLSPVVSGRQ